MNNKRGVIYSLAGLFLTTPVIAQASVGDYKPIVEKDFYIERYNFSCPMRYHKDSSINRTKDFCDNQGNMDVKVTLSMMRSVALAQDDGTYTQDKKYFRVTGVENEGGGIHLRKN